ncbi:MAG: spore cortex biosynthesis protein YabQ [Clostridia bacterium]|nr:spore cortex biosynthesis protein YabQ [Clostridia bacterium]
MAFLLSLPVGAALSVIYGMLRILRLTLKWRSEAPADLIFCMVSWATAFLFLLYSADGELRLHLLIGLAGGFFLWRYTLGDCLENVFISAVHRIFRIISKIWRCICLQFRRLWAIIQKSKWIRKFSAWRERRRRSHEAESQKQKGRNSSEARAARRLYLHRRGAHHHVRTH